MEKTYHVGLSSMLFWGQELFCFFSFDQAGRVEIG